MQFTGFVDVGGANGASYRADLFSGEFFVSHCCMMERFTYVGCSISLIFEPNVGISQQTENDELDRWVITNDLSCGFSLGKSLKTNAELSGVVRPPLRIASKSYGYTAFSHEASGE